jgi:homoserine kinase type II
MNAEHLALLCVDFSLGEVIAIKGDLEGVLNKNYFLTTDTGKYFIKSIRQKRRAHIPYIAQVEEFMRSRGIPAVCMLHSRSGKKFVEYGAEIYTVYPFIENSRSHVYAAKDFGKMGSMLAQIHVAGSKAVPPMLAAKFFKEKPHELVVSTLERRREHLLAKESLDDTDVLFLKYINLKLQKISTSDDVPLLPKDTLVHGDYHARNLLLNNERDIIGICDWEQSDVNARAYELARSVLYVCFNGEEHESSHVYDMDLSIHYARAFISGYSSVYPISNDELLHGMRLRVSKLIYSKWIEEQYYDQGDSRANGFILHEMRLIEDFSQERFLILLEQ